MIKKIYEHFKKQDVILYSYINRVEPITILKRAHPDTYFYKICYEIVGQQLSDKSSSAIFSRFKKLFKKDNITARELLNISHELLRNAGMSHAKARYVRNLAEAVEKGNLDFYSLPALNDEQVIKKLTEIKGIGRWTAEMFLMFTLGCENVFSHGDLGLKKAIKKIYRFKNEPLREKIDRITNRWSPYKTYGCQILWRSLEI